MVYSFFILSNLVMSLRPIAYGWFVSSLQGEESGILSFAWTYVAIYMGIYLLEWVFHGPAVLMGNRLNYNIGKNFVSHLYDQLLHLPVDWHKRHHTGATVHRIKKAENGLKSFFGGGAFHLRLIIQFVTAVSAMIYFSPLFAFIVIIFGFFSILAIMRFDRPYVRCIGEVNEGEYKISATLTDSLSNIITIITLRLEKRFSKQLLDKIEHVFNSFWKGVLFKEGKWFTASFLVNVIYCTMVIGYVYSNYESGEVFDLGGLVTLLGFVSQFTGVFVDVGSLYSQIIKNSTDVRSVAPIQKFYESNNQATEYEALPEAWNKLEIRNLNFKYDNIMDHLLSEETLEVSYDNNGQKGLQDVNIDIRRGQRIALIGHNGSGKTTLMSILKGLYKPEPGTRLLIDGKEIKEWRSLGDRITLFPQQPEIFENTIRDNLTLGLQFSDEEIAEACKISGFDMVLDQLSKGLNYEIHENGNNLSGGQKQRLVLARGILASQNSSIILLDEFTSNIDQQTEAEIYKALFEAFKDKIIIWSTQKLSLLSLFDVIYFMEKGKVVFQGSYEEVMENFGKEHVDFFTDLKEIYAQ
jgi:ATP-binding cassette subfamily B protein